MTFIPNDDQAQAIADIESFLLNRAPDEYFYCLGGYAGTGKTSSVQELLRRVKGRMVFTAPTNKATKVLRQTLTRPDYKPECRTIYSLLGLRLEANGEVRELSVPEDPIDLSAYRAVFVDEGSMINEVVMQHIRKTAAEFNIPFIFMGDPAQLPPVKEYASPIWQIDRTSFLTKVMRHDNQILEFVTRVRNVVDHPMPSIKILANNADGEGVFVCTPEEFRLQLMKAAHVGAFSKPENVKAIAWRNVTVDALNKFIRSHIFDDTSSPWLVGDRVIATAPVKDLEDEVVASTDDEGLIQRVEIDYHPVYPEFKIYILSVTLDDNRPVTFRVLHESSVNAFKVKEAELAASARMDRKRWPAFWDFKEAFHSIRYAYAITAHRAQGSTYETAFVDWRDILINQNRREAFRCLYVAASRPKKRLILN